MIIHPPEKRLTNGQVIVSARIETERDHGLPTHLSYSTSIQYADLVSDRVELFLSNLVMIACQINENIEVRGPLSPTLLYGLKELMLVLTQYWPLLARSVDISAPQLQPAHRPTHNIVNGLAFSGGSDSLYSLWSQRPETAPRPEFKIHYALHVIEQARHALSDEDYAAYTRYLESTAQHMGAEFIPISSNFLQFNIVGHNSSNVAGLLVSLGHLFQPLLSNYLIPSSDSYKTMLPRSMGPMTDPLFSSESLKIRTHANEVNRLQKIAALSTWPTFLDHVQVCNRPKSAALNCCRCDKCVQTILTLNVLGVLDQAKTFPLPMKPRHYIFPKIITDAHRYQISLQLNKFAWRNKKFHLLPYLFLAQLRYLLGKVFTPHKSHARWEWATQYLSPQTRQRLKKFLYR